MKIYLVGGAVRDKLLNHPYFEHDWVVVGARPQDLEAQGFKAVGKDFPVFLHPETGEEYALARTERKTGHGYGGFSFHATPEVSLEEDLRRRDLTINAMAEDDAGQIIDPYGGREDLRGKKLRHVSPAFAEDPVRVLRVARFAARYHHLGFTIANETLELMQDIVTSGEVDHLVPERAWKETERALMEPNPEIFVRSLRDCGALAKIMPELEALFGVPQVPEHHPEVDTGEHALMALQQAVKLKGSARVRFASLIHDLGKAETPKESWPKHIGHETRSLPLIESLCERMAVPKDHRALARLVAQYHTHGHRALELKPSTLLNLIKAADAFRRPERYGEFILCCEADARGRTGLERRDYPQAEYLRQALICCLSIDNKEIAERGFIGKDFGEALDRERQNRLAQLKSEYSNPN